MEPRVDYRSLNVCVVNVPHRNDAIKTEDQDGHLENQLATPHQQFPAVHGTFSIV